MKSDDAGMLKGRIVKWDQAKGFGFLRAGNRKLFLHRRDFSGCHKKPEVGDRIRFTIGSDPKGRPCATNAEQVNYGGRIATPHVLVALLLLGLPLFALYRGGINWMWAGGYIIAINVLTCGAYAFDKRRAQARQWRVSEAQLHLMEALGGWPGAFLAQRGLRHKCSKGSYQLIFWIVVLAYQLAAFDSLQNWQLARKVSIQIRAHAGSIQ